MDTKLHNLSLNQRTIARWTLPEAVTGCVRAGIPSLGVWREPLQDYGLERAVSLIAGSGLRVSSLCRGGFFTARDQRVRNQALDDNRRAVDEASRIGAPCLVLVVGGLPEGDRDLVSARARVADAIDQLVPHAADAGVQLALEPMHPMFCADRGVLSTLSQALDIAERYAPEHVGVVIDTLHVWWDPYVDEQIARSAGRIASFQVSDWITPLPGDVLLGRGIPGDGHIDFRHLRRAVEKAGYHGDIEIEIFNADVWAADPEEVLRRIADSFAEHVLDAPDNTTHYEE